MTTPLTLLRLTPEQSSGWIWWPEYERRVVEATLLFAPRTAPEKVIAHLRRLWGTAPLTLGAWMIFRDPVPGNGHRGLHTVGHLCSWLVTDEWGETSILLYQLRVDRGIRATVLAQPVLDDLEDWRHEINTRYTMEQTRQGQPVREVVQRVKFFTTRGMHVWLRYLRGLVRVADVEEVGTLDMLTVRRERERVETLTGENEIERG